MAGRHQRRRGGSRGTSLRALTTLTLARGSSAFDYGVDAANASCVVSIQPLHNETWVSGQHSAPSVIMPPNIRYLLEANWSMFDADAERVVAAFNGLHLGEFGHARSTFHDHLLGTYGMLAAWGQPVDVMRCGLVHTAYSGDLFQFFVFDADSEHERAELRAIVGAAGEELTWLFGTVHRGALVGLEQLISGEAHDDADSSVRRLAAYDTDTVDVAHRLLGTVELTNSQIAKLVVVTIADYLEQMVEINGWRDHHQEEDLSSSLFPGDGRPAVALHWLSHACAAIRDHLEIVPPVFARCTRVLSAKDELHARDAYWYVVMREREDRLGEAVQRASLQTAIDHNPFVGEPHILLAQLDYRAGAYASAIWHCDAALTKLYAMATAWDKRRSYGAWVGYARMLRLRASRMLDGHSTSLPLEMGMPPTHAGRSLVSVRKLKEMMP